MVIRMKEIIAVLLISLVFFAVYMFINNITTYTETSIERQSYSLGIQPQKIVFPNDTDITTVIVPAVDMNGNGVATSLMVDAMPGKGRTLVDINQILFWVDTQNSINTAKKVAENITGLDLSKYDIVYSIRANASVIEGPSAGAAMTIATILELQDKELNEYVTITGTINDDGSIGEVSGIVAKGKAAEDIGMSLFLVPEGQRKYTTYKEVKKCEEYVFRTICWKQIKPENVDVENEVGIKVIEVANIEEALKYFAM
jgi:uncharacterized protein